jgi:hypothetical protein
MIDTGSFAMPVRRVSNWGGNIIGSFPSLKNGHPVMYESTIERDFLYVLEYDTSVLRYEMQPLVITGINASGKKERYVPDILVEQTWGKTLVECKPAALIQEARSQRQLRLGREWAETEGCDFVVVTDTELRTGHQLANLRLFWRYARLVVPHPVIERCLTILHAYPDGILWAELLLRLDGSTPTLMLPPCLYSLLFHHVLTTNIQAPLSSESVILLPDR